MIKTVGGRTQRMKKGLMRFFYQNKVLVLLAVLFLAGVFAGAFLVRANGDSWNTFIGQLITGFTKQRQTQSISETFLHTFGSAALYLGVLFLCGFCAVGQPLVSLTIIFRGIGYGLTAGSVYSVYGLGGMGYVAAMLLPNCVLTVLALLVGGQSAFRFSAGVYGAMKGAKQVSARPYAFTFVALGVYLLAVSLLDAVLNLCFRSFFIHIG